MKKLIVSLAVVFTSIAAALASAYTLHALTSVTRSVDATVTVRLVDTLGLCGDLNGDGKVGIADVVISLQALVELFTPSAAQLILGDLNRDGDLGVADTIILLQHTSGLHPQLHTCGPPGGSLSTVTLAPIKDNTLHQSDDGALSNGAGAHIFAGKNESGEARRAVIAFDIAGNIPPGASIIEVELSLNMSRTTSGAQTVSLHRLLADWGEGASDAPGEEGGGAPSQSGDATWIHRFFDSEQWNISGGDFAPGASASTLVAGLGEYTWSSEQMSADVQAWLDSPSTSFGWILIGNESASRTSKRFDSRENDVEASRPSLRVTFTQ
ncbi:MAG: DNRLRE domain-containing protein [Chloroflexi bacterium]|nr:DNRLRE domain-containing protein [Chloroflexota bacterium]